MMFEEVSDFLGGMVGGGQTGGLLGSFGHPIAAGFFDRGGEAPGTILTSDVIPERSFFGPDPRLISQSTVTPQMLRQIDLLSGIYGPRLREVLDRPRTQIPFASLLVPPAAQTVAAGQGLERAMSGLDAVRARGPVNVDNIYDVATTEGLRRYRTEALPAIAEQFGVRGNRYSTDLARTSQQSAANLIGGLEIERARAKANEAARFAEQDIRTSGAQAGVAQGMTGVGAILQALEESNLLRLLAEQRARDLPVGSQFFPAIQGFLANRPVYDPFVTNNPMFQPATTVADELAAAGPIIGAVLRGIIGGG